MTGFSWIFGGMMVLFCITGLSMMETGYARSKNAGSVMMEAIVGVCVAIPTFLVIGGYIAGFEKEGALMLESTLAAFVCCIMVGGMLGRVQIPGYMIMSFVVSAFSYPLSVRICQELNCLGAYQDFGGFGTVFVTGASVAYMGSKMLGPRTGKSTKGGAAFVVPGHNIPFALAGSVMLVIGIIGIAGANGLYLQLTDETISRVAENVVVGGTVAGLVGFLFTYIRYKKPDMTMTASALIAGFVASLPGCDVLSITTMTVISVMTGFICIIAIESLERGAKVDDPSGVISIFGVGGFVGLLGAGVFGGSVGLKAIPGNLAACILVFIVNAIIVGITGIVLKQLHLLRITIEQEVEGCDLFEFGLANAYNDFQLNLDTTDWSNMLVSAMVGEDGLETNVKEPYHYDNTKEFDKPITKIEIICRKEKLEALKLALNDIGIMGMTVSQVTGCGVQKGFNEFYRGVPLSIQLRAKVRVEVVVAKVPVDEVVNTARRVLYTGHVGDGKIFIYNISDVVRVRTGESGYDAMQGALSE